MSEDKTAAFRFAAYRSLVAKRRAKESWKTLMREAVVLACDQAMGNPVDPTHALNLAAEVQSEFDRLFAEQPFTRREQVKFYGRQLAVEGFVAQYSPMQPASAPEPEDKRFAYSICDASPW